MTNINFDPVSAGVSLVGAGLGQLFFKRNLKAQTAAQMQLMDKQIKSNKDLYDYQMQDQRSWNEYEEQLGKMSDVGMNPLTFDGSGGAGTASIGSAGLGSPGSPVSPQFDLVSAITNALQAEDIKIHKRATDSAIQLNEAKTAEAYATRDEILAKKDWTDTDKERLFKVMEQIDVDIQNQSQRVLNETKQTALLKARLSLDKAEFGWRKWMDERNYGLSERGMQVQEYNSRTSRLSQQVAERTLQFNIGKWDQEYSLSYDRTMNDIKNNNLDSITKYIDSFKTAGISGQMMLKCAGVLDAVNRAILGNKNSNDSNLKKHISLQNQAKNLIHVLDGVTVFDGIMPYKPKSWKWNPGSRSNYYEAK